MLARIEGAPGGSKGISMFIVPKIRDEEASRNAVRCIGVEEKMGIHASPTCTMAYEGATGWLIGEENRGLAAMFTMMNAARLNVGVQGVADRRSRLPEGAGLCALSASRAARLIIHHPDVRRMLTTMRAKIQAGRAICYAAAVAADSGDKAREDLLTPIAKAWCTDLGVEAASLGVQVHGGMGFVEEGGAAQFYRDARIAPIYEGANGIQAIDLYGRKLLSDRGEAMGAFINDAREAGAALEQDPRRPPRHRRRRARGSDEIHAERRARRRARRRFGISWRWLATSPAAYTSRAASPRARPSGDDQGDDRRSNRALRLLLRDRPCSRPCARPRYSNRLGGARPRRSMRHAGL